MFFQKNNNSRRQCIRTKPQPRSRLPLSEEWCPLGIVSILPKTMRVPLSRWECKEISGGPGTAKPRGNLFDLCQFVSHLTCKYYSSHFILPHSDNLQSHIAFIIQYCLCLVILSLCVYIFIVFVILFYWVYLSPILILVRNCKT